MEIYYFSGTGNSLAVAKAIAKETKGTVISIASVLEKGCFQSDADTIGIVFPCYLAQLVGVPLIIRKFIQNFINIHSKYIFAVCTCGGLESFNALPTLKILRKLIQSRGGNLSGEFSIRLPMNNLNYYFFQSHNHEAMFKKSKKKIKRIGQYVNNKKKSKFQLVTSLFHRLITPMNKSLGKLYIDFLKEKSKEQHDTILNYQEMIPLTDKSIFVDDKCNGCGICEKVCPVTNIQIIKKKPVWQHHCEMCMACVEWCPIKAIHHWNIVEGRKYHHPEISLSEMLRKQ